MAKFLINIAILLTVALIQSSLGLRLNSGILNGQYAGTPIKDRVTGEIIGKNNGEFPYMAALEKEGKHKCGAVIITRSLVLTAAHCVFDLSEDDIQVSAGSYKRDDTANRKRQIRKVKLIVKHPSYYRPIQSHDLAVVALKKDFVFNSLVGAVLLPKVNQNFIGQKLTVLGWGIENGRKAKYLKKTLLTVINHNECKPKMNYVLDSSMLCTLDKPNYKSGHSEGDSGGPLVLKSSTNDPKRDILVGIVSFSEKKNKIPDTKHPYIAANVPVLVSWVNEVISQHKTQKGIFDKLNCLKCRKD